MVRNTMCLLAVVSLWLTGCADEKKDDTAKIDTSITVPKEFAPMPGAAPPPAAANVPAHNPAELAIGKVAPDIEGEDIDGVPFKLCDYRGKVVLLDFWGDW